MLEALDRRDKAFSTILAENVRKMARAPLAERIALLKRAGILDAKGNLAEPYCRGAGRNGSKKRTPALKPAKR